MESLKGHFLIAPVMLQDPNFLRSVVLMVEHNEDGAMGLVLNRPLDTTIQQIWDEVSEISCEMKEPIHQGGPCEGPLMVLHTDAGHADMRVMPGLYFSTDRQMIEELIEQNQSPIRFFVGYSGWTKGQLEAEIEAGGWMVIPATVQQVFAADEMFWELLMRAISRATAFPGLNPKVIPEDPSLN